MTDITDDLTAHLAKAIRAAWVDRLDWDELAHAALKFLTSTGRLIPAGGHVLTAEEWANRITLADKQVAVSEAWEQGFEYGSGHKYGAEDDGVRLTAEQVEDVRIVLGQLERGGPAFEAAHERLRALFPATEPAEDLRVHNHTPHRGPGPGGHCAELTENGRLRGQCMTDIAIAPTVARCPKELEGDIESFPCVLSAGHRERHKSAGGLTWGYFAPAEPAEEHCTVPPEGWWCSRAANHEGPCAASEGVAPWVPQPLEADWLDQVDPRDPQSRTHRETAAAKFVEPAEEETKAEAQQLRDLSAALRAALGILDPLEGEGWSHAWRTADDLDDCANRISSPVVPAPTETGPWQRIEDIPDGVEEVSDCDGHLWWLSRNVVEEWHFDGTDPSGTKQFKDPSDFAPLFAIKEES
ncbi:hypothetical protein [Rhodococcus qingshengii]|uniref:hypothetical protein n=1 Tax=Rhodococcus qingshengii TaxID=334542 RepID=UPI00210B3630|nr:hypothetical protein [Rhodococcus qingshengii]MCQ4148605.1 hypothetical protein [Rhodococcus qingshengii]